MALPKRKSRLITVENRNFRWMITDKGDQLILTIQEEVEKTPKAQQFTLHPMAIQPADVAKIIKEKML